MPPLFVKQLSFVFFGAAAFVSALAPDDVWAFVSAFVFEAADAAAFVSAAAFVTLAVILCCYF